MVMYELLLRVDGPLEKYPSGVAKFISLPLLPAIVLKLPPVTPRSTSPYLPLHDYTALIMSIPPLPGPLFSVTPSAPNTP